jgi:hypothetical protein
MVVTGRRKRDAFATSRATHTEVSDMALTSLAKLGSFSLVATVFSFAVAGCTADAASSDEVSAEGALVSGITPGEFKLYSEPRANPNPSCDVHTSLVLTNVDGVSLAKLSEVVGGFCEIFVPPQEREYRLTFSGTACGSQIFQGTTTVEGKARAITIVDHRSRICRDLPEAEIIVEETYEDGTKRRLYSYDGAPSPAPTSKWLTYAPRQCGTNPWNGVQPAFGQHPSYLAGESGEVDVFFRNAGIELDQIGFALPAEPMVVCMACLCPRGDRLIVHTKSTADAQKLVSEFGFAPLENALATEPVGCGLNPWERGAKSGASETELLSSWAASVGAPLAWVGFLDYTEPMAVCAACGCPRGDTAIAIPKDAASASRLEDLGWKRVEN